MASSSRSTEFWHTNLSLIPDLSYTFIEKFSRDNLPIKATLTRGFKFSRESYIHDIEVRQPHQKDDFVSVRGKCFRSMKKNESPHQLLLLFKLRSEACVKQFKCSCAAGKGLCQHMVGLLYTLCDYKMLGHKSVPPIVSKTSKPQTWHIPNRVDGIKPRPVMDVKVQKVKMPSTSIPKKKRKVTGVTSTIYNPFPQPLHTINLPEILKPSFKDLEPQPGFLRIWPDDDEDIPLAVTKFGIVPRGSVIAYQQPQISNEFLQPTIDMAPPIFTFPDVHSLTIVLTEKQQVHYESLKVTKDQSLEYEVMTREQSSNKDWHRLRKNRLTASNFKSVVSRRKDFESLSKRLLQSKNIKTAAMKYGIMHEDAAAQYYSEQSGNRVFKVGFVINPSVPHLGGSPDRRVHDETENPPWGLLEIKCSVAERLHNVKYLKFNAATGKYSLRKSHQYYCQVMGCLGLTGSAWGDFFVYCKQEFHRERVYFNEELFIEILDKLHLFYFNVHILSAIC